MPRKRKKDVPEDTVLRVLLRQRYFMEQLKQHVIPYYSRDNGEYVIKYIEAQQQDIEKALCKYVAECKGKDGLQYGA